MTTELRQLDDFLRRLGKTDPEVLGWARSLLVERDALRALHRSDRLADLEALREVTEELVVAADPYRRQYLAEKAEDILRRLRRDEPPERDAADYEHERVAS